MVLRKTFDFFSFNKLEISLLVFPLKNILLTGLVTEVQDMIGCLSIVGVSFIFNKMLYKTF